MVPPIGAAPLPGLGYPQVLTMSTPVPLVTPRSIAYPVAANGCATACPTVGASTTSTGVDTLACSVTRVVNGSQLPSTVSYTQAQMRYVPAGFPATTN